MNETLSDQLDNFISDYLKKQVSSRGLPCLPYDPDWPSECYQESARDGALSPWQPVLQNVSKNNCQEMFDRLEKAMGYPIHQDIRTWYSRYWSDPIPAHCEKGDLSLLFVWNEEDCERLRGNLIGHLLTKQKQKRPATLFFACTEPDGDQFISLDNQTGEIWLEQPGKAPIMKLADNLSDFISQLSPGLIENQE